MLQTIKENKILFLLLLTYPVVLFLTIPLLPTHDDWTDSLYPQPFNLTLFLPQLGYWRIPDVLYGWVCSHIRWLLPSLGHFISVSGHYIGMVMIWKLCEKLQFSKLSQVLASIFFLVSTGMIAAVTACDGMAQIWTHTLGMMAFYSFLCDTEQKKTPLKWIAIVFFACLIKENALAWFFIIPFLALSLQWCQWKTLKGMIIPLCIAMAVYLTLRFGLPPVSDSPRIKDDYKDVFNPLMIIRGIVFTLAYPWMPIDYAALVQTEHRNIFIVIVTFIIVIPFIYCLFLASVRSKINRTTLTLFISIFLTVGIHIITVFSLMHIYSCMGVAALLLAAIVNSDKGTTAKTYILSFTLYAITAVCVDVHHYKAAYDSGIMGQKLTREAISKTTTPAEKLSIIYYDNGYKKYSNFYVIPVEAIGWGRAAQWETRYSWPKIRENYYVTDESEIDSISREKISEGFDCVWIVRSESPRHTAEGKISVDVINK